jgi:hypothetical protein
MDRFSTRSFQPFEELFAKLGHFVVSEPNGFLQENIKTTLYHAVVQQSFLALLVHENLSSLDNQYRRVPFSTKLIGLNVV